MLFIPDRGLDQLGCERYESGAGAAAETTTLTLWCGFADSASYGYPATGSNDKSTPPLKHFFLASRPKDDKIDGT